jgi:hypothetical protein
MLALPIAAPDGSVTVPSRSARSICANAAAPRISVKMTATALFETRERIERECFAFIKLSSLVNHQLTTADPENGWWKLMRAKKRDISGTEIAAG